MPGSHIDEKRRQDFKDYLANLNGWTIEESLKDQISDKICIKSGERLEEFIDTFKLLILYTDKSYYKELHRSDTREIKPKSIQKGMHVSLIIEPYSKPSSYPYIMRLYFTYNNVIYDFEISRQTAKAGSAVG